MANSQRKESEMRHIGIDSFFGEKRKLITQYEIAKIQAREDPVQTEHGVAAEALVRDWLRSFLPQKFGVCKGYVITPKLGYEGVLEEWDVIIYDALESPILYSRDLKGQDESEEKKGIPVEYVKAVIEVKATFNPNSAKLVAKKLSKLKHFIGDNSHKSYPTYFSESFFCSAIFLETKLKNLNEQIKALDYLAYLINSGVNFQDALVVKSQKNDDHSAHLQYMQGATNTDLTGMVYSTSIKYNSSLFFTFGSSMYSKNQYPDYLFSLINKLNGKRIGGVPSFYGIDFSDTGGHLIFKAQPKPPPN